MDYSQMESLLVKPIYDTIEEYCTSLDLSGYKGLKIDVGLAHDGVDAEVYRDGDESTIAISPILVNEFFEGINGKNLWFTNTIHHEFCHIDIVNKTKQVQSLMKQEAQQVEGTIEGVILTTSLVLYNEYMANRLSSPSVPRDKYDDTRKHFIDMFNSVESPLDASNYFHRVRHMGYFLGYTNKFGDKLQTFELIRNDDFLELVNKAHEHLVKITRRYPRLCYEGLLDLADIIEVHYELLVNGNAI